MDDVIPNSYSCLYLGEPKIKSKKSWIKHISYGRPYFLYSTMHTNKLYNWDVMKLKTHRSNIRTCQTHGRKPPDPKYLTHKIPNLQLQIIIFTHIDILSVIS